jgi:hypothetical protein
MSNTILTANFSRPQFIATNEVTNAEIWRGLAVVSAEIDPSAAVTEMPIAVDGPKDSNTTVQIQEADLRATKIIQPVRLKVQAVISDLSVIESIISLLNGDTTTLSVNTKSIITRNLLLTDVGIQQSGEMTSAARVSMMFEQAQPPAGEGYNPEQPADASVYGIGFQDLRNVSALGSLMKSVTAALSRPVEVVFGPLINMHGGPVALDHPTQGQIA